jgi:SAM-dependent methyltransferase
MPIESALNGLATSVQRRLSRRWRRHAAATAAEPPPISPAPAPDPLIEEARAFVLDRIHARFASDGDGFARSHDLNHVRRYATSLTWVPHGSGRIIDPAAGPGLFPDLVRRFRGQEVEVPAFFNLETEPAPYPDASFDGVILTEVLEHFAFDPMACMAELNRIVKPGGFLFLTTPNLASWVALYHLLHHETPYLFGVFERHHTSNRHNREYTVREVGRLAEAAGFGVERLDAITVYDGHDAVGPLPGIDPALRGDTTFLLARKEGPVRDRYPEWLYTNWAAG